MLNETFSVIFNHREHAVASLLWKLELFTLFFVHILIRVALTKSKQGYNQGAIKTTGCSDKFNSRIFRRLDDFYRQKIVKLKYELSC